MINRLNVLMACILAVNAVYAQRQTFEEVDPIDNGNFYLREFRLEVKNETLKDLTVSCKKVKLKYYFIADSASYGFQSKKISLALVKFNDTGSIAIDSVSQHWFVWFELTDQKKKNYMFGTNQIYVAVDTDGTSYSDRLHYHVSDKNICDSSILAKLGPKARFLKQ